MSFETDGFIASKLNFASVKDVPNIEVGTKNVPNTILGTSFMEAKFNLVVLKPSVSNNVIFFKIVKEVTHKYPILQITRISIEKLIFSYCYINKLKQIFFIFKDYS